MVEVSNICRVIGCDLKVRAKQLCIKHWKRQHKGIPLYKKSMFEKNDEERFWEKVQKGGLDECWIWQGGKRGTETKYGVAWINGEFMGAHRYSYELHYGPIPKTGGDIRGMCVCHKCDNPLCVNPSHLFIGTHTDNMRDKVRKGRDRGSKTTHCPQGHPYSKLNTYVSKRRLRSCRTCHRERENLRRLKLQITSKRYSYGINT